MIPAIPALSVGSRRRRVLHLIAEPHLLAVPDCFMLWNEKGKNRKSNVNIMLPFKHGTTKTGFADIIHTFGTCHIRYAAVALGLTFL